ncbi:MAG: endonuclease/exonuclease/phosphatase family protein [Verrucomicrobiota bacterium]
MNTHIDYRRDDAERLINAAELEEIVAAAGKMPVVLCGDFNDSPKSRTHQKVGGFLSDTWELAGEGDGFTIPAAKPNSRIDYIWISKESIEPLRIEVLKSIASDHLPVLGEFRLR